MPTSNVDKLTHAQIKQVLPTGWSVGKEYETECPLCQHAHLRLFGTDGFNCMNGCDPGALAKELRKRIGNSYVPSRRTITANKKTCDWKAWQGFTVAEYSSLKRLSSLALNVYFEVHEVTYHGRPAVAFPYMNAEGRVLGSKIRLLDTRLEDNPIPRFLFDPKDPHIPYGVWLYTNRKTEQGWPKDLVICEGESDVQTLTAYNIPAIGISGSKAWKAEFAKLPVIQNAERIFIIEEHDAEGPEFVKRVMKDLPAGKAFALRLPDDKDPNELHTRLTTLKDFCAPDVPSFDDEFNRAIALATAVEDHAPICTVESVTLDQYKSKVVKWAWQDRIPLGFVTLFYGLPSQGKSTVSADVVARISNGQDFFDQKSSLPASDVLMLLAEDDVPRTVKPRMIAAGADLSRVHIVQGTVDSRDPAKQRMLALGRDMEALVRKLEDMPNCRLIVFDPIASYLGELDRNKDKDVRPVLNDLNDLVRDRDVAILALTHFNKSSGQTAIHRITGAGCWSEIPRAAWAFVGKPTEEGEQPSKENLMLNGKLNFVSDARKAGLRYTFESVIVPTDDGNQADVGKIVWLDKTSHSLDDVMKESAVPRGPKPQRTDAAEAWLRSILADNEAHPSKEIDEQGVSAGHEWRMLQRVRYERMKDEIEVAKWRGEWTWRLKSL